MPGARPFGFRLGDRAELLAEFILSGLSFVVPVPRQEDVGHDFLCTLSKRKGNMIHAGPFFTIQVKSKKQDINYEKDHEVEWVKRIENPFFICVADRENLRISLYSTWNRLSTKPFITPSNYVFSPGDQNDSYQKAKENKGTIFVPLGKPILIVSAKDTIDNERSEYLSSILRQWIIIDRLNIVNMDAGMHWIIGPNEYEINKPIKMDKLLQYFFSPPLVRNDLQKKVENNFGRTAMALNVLLQRKQHNDGKLSMSDANKVDVLNKVISMEFESFMQKEENRDQ